ncbi:hypothetical protein D9M72_481790 [compost metagenome]
MVAWHDGIGTYRQAHAQVLLPLEDELLAARRQWVFALDELLGQPRGWTKTDRETLRELVCDAASELLHARDGNGDEDDELKALFARHAEIDFDTERQQMVRSMRDAAEVKLQLQIEGVEMRFCFVHGLETGRAAIDPNELGQLLEQHSRQLRAELSQQQRDMRMLADTVATKRWLKQQRQLLREPAYGLDPFF